MRQPSLLAELEEFGAPRPHGSLHAEAGEPTENGYMVEVRCCGGVVFMRWVMPVDVVEDGIYERLGKL